MTTTDESSLSNAADSISEIQLNAHWKESDFCHDFTDPQMDHDRILLVGGKDLHVISNILTESSDFFKILFGENFKESGQEKIELKDVETEDFTEYLSHLYPNNREITKDNFFPLFTLADRYLTPFIFKKCTDFITENPDVVNDFGQRAFDLLQMAIDMDLTDVMDVFEEIFSTSSPDGMCKKCKQAPKLRDGENKHPDGRGRIEDIYMDKNHICIKHSDYILDQKKPEIIAFILKSIVNSYPDTGDKPEKSVIDSEKEFSTKEYFTYDFANKGPNHDSCIVVKNIRKNTEQIFNVDSKIVCSGAKWFRGRLEKGSKLEISDVKTAHFELFLNYIYPNAHYVTYENCPVLLAMSAHFEAPCLYRKVFKEMVEDWIYITEAGILHYEVAVKYNLRDVKKLIYKEMYETPLTLDCLATDEHKEHPFVAEGVYMERFDGLFYDNPVHTISAEAQRFILACLLKKVSKCL